MQRLWAVCMALVAVMLLAGAGVPATAAGTMRAVIPATAVLTSDCPSHMYLGNNPDGTNWPDWSENAQGIANDGYHWFFTDVNGLFKYDANWTPVDGADSGKLKSIGIPEELVKLGIDHFGDPDYYRGYLFVPFEAQNLSAGVIGVFRATDLALVDWFDVLPFQARAGWAAIDPVKGVLYSSTDRIVAGTPLRRYVVDISKIENDSSGDFLTPTTSMTLLEADGAPVSGQFIYMQGGVFTPLGDLYLSVGKTVDSPSSTRGGLHLFRRTSDDSAFQLVESSVNESGHEGEHVFAYEYHPGWELNHEEEPEGLDWWNRDNVSGSRYSGQLHAILLDNDAGDDKIWLKHYRIGYDCVGDADSDGDGLSDHDEVYVYNTHPSVKDTDRDGQWDGGEVACGSDPLDPSSLAPDLDGDHAPDCVDADDDGDGELDLDEITCGSNPRDAASLPPDFDGDATPDCFDLDDDNDDVADNEDRCPGTLIPDPVIPSSDTLKKNRYALFDNDLVFDGGTATPAYTTSRTGGCNATQIADAMGLGLSHYEYGIPGGLLDAWIASTP